MRYIDRTPPVITGNTKADLQSIAAYLSYLQEQMNFILSSMEKQRKNGG